MDDIRVDDRKKKLDNKVKIYNFLYFLKKNWKKLIVFILIVSILAFPTFFGNIISGWIRDFVTPFMTNLKF